MLFAVARLIIEIVESGHYGDERSHRCGFNPKCAADGLKGERLAKVIVRRFR
jgi:hypothetical protein